MKKNTKQCPNVSCKMSIMKGNNIAGSQVQCPKCQSGSFCFNCLLPWKSDQSGSCKSDVCSFQRKMILEAPWTREFSMYRKGDNTENRFSVKVPNLRACPRCGMLIDNIEYCKHTKCTCMSNTKSVYSFCYVCLSLSPTDGSNWKCGGPYEYCGFVAPNQILTEFSNNQ